MVIERHPAEGLPSLPANDRHGAEVIARNLHCDVVVIGQGEAEHLAALEAQQVGLCVITLDATAGQEVIGIYPGPLGWLAPMKGCCMSIRKQRSSSPLARLKSIPSCRAITWPGL